MLIKCNAGILILLLSIAGYFTLNRDKSEKIKTVNL